MIWSLAYPGFEPTTIQLLVELLYLSSYAPCFDRLEGIGLIPKQVKIDEHVFFRFSFQGWKDASGDWNTSHDYVMGFPDHCDVALNWTELNWSSNGAYP
jgi:hypothetical protein